MDKLNINNNSCYYCDITLDNDNRTIEHIVPRSKHGNNTVFNLLPCCRACNIKRGNSSLIDYKKIIINGYTINQIDKLIEYVDRKGNLLYTTSYLLEHNFIDDAALVFKAKKCKTKNPFDIEEKFTNQRFQNKLKQLYPHSFNMIEERVWTMIYKNIIKDELIKF